MFRLGKIKSVVESYLSQYRNSSPASYAAAQQAVGGLLIIDGFIGIDNPLGNNKRSGIFGSLIGIIVGLLMIFGAGYFGNLMGIHKLTATTTAQVVSVRQSSSASNDSSSSCTATAKYTVDNKEYTQASMSGSNTDCSLSPGQNIDITYDPNNPGAWAHNLDAFKAVLNIVPIIGIIVAIASFITFIIRILSIIIGWKLLKSGRALASTLPEGTDISTVVHEIKQHFTQYLFGMGTGGVVSNDLPNKNDLS